MRRTHAPAFASAIAILIGTLLWAGSPLGSFAADPPKPTSPPAAPDKKDDSKAAPPAAPPAAVPAATPAKAADPKPTDKKTEKPADKNDEKPAEAKFTTKIVPENLDDLKALEAQVEKVAEKTREATVGVRVGSAQGSGIIVTKDGYVLTAGHVVGEPDREVEFIFPDGKKVKGKTLGVNHDIDSGLMKITDAGEWPFIEMGKSADMKPGDWVIVTGHPGGYHAGRPPVVRLGKLIQNRNGTMWTDATLVGGDSGGPMFNLDGKVIGINSRISGPLTTNYHVPVDTFRDTWDRLAKSEEWGQGTPRNSAWLGVTVEPTEKGCRITEIAANSPAAKAEIKVKDIISKIDGKDVKDVEGLQGLLQKKKVGNDVTVTILRGDETLEKKATLVKRPAGV